VTTPFLEPDRCATAWVLKRRLYADAEFRFHARGAFPDKVVLYDLPEAALRRDARRTTLEVLIEREQMDDPLVLRLARLVHDIEINAWATRREPGSLRFEAVLVEAFREAESPEEALEACFELLDGLAGAQGDVESWLGEVVQPSAEAADDRHPEGRAARHQRN
jgi:hypothetical protein